jgi:hypothetical protein
MMTDRDIPVDTSLPSPLSDLTNVQLVDITPIEEQGMSVENAYRHLAGMPPEPVNVEEEI